MRRQSYWRSWPLEWISWLFLYVQNMKKSYAHATTLSFEACWVLQRPFSLWFCHIWCIWLALSQPFFHYSNLFCFPAIFDQESWMSIFTEFYFSDLIIAKSPLSSIFVFRFKYFQSTLLFSAFGFICLSHRCVFMWWYFNLRSYQAWYHFNSLLVLLYQFFWLDLLVNNLELITLALLSSFRNCLFIVYLPGLICANNICQSRELWSLHKMGPFHTIFNIVTFFMKIAWFGVWWYRNTFFVTMKKIKSLMKIRCMKVTKFR